MSLCDTCPAPGHCCRSIILGGGEPWNNASTTQEAEAWLAKINEGWKSAPLPFRPLFKRTDGAWVWWCPNLNPKTGRCDDYENRPHTCVMYEPKTDALCVLHDGN